jgi:hypothetical protein
VPSSAAQSRLGRIITRMATMADTTDLDHIPTDRRLVAACGTVTPGCPLASHELDWRPPERRVPARRLGLAGRPVAPAP